VVVADDDAGVREGLAHLLLYSGFAVAGQAGDGSQLLDLVRELTPDLVVADNRMPPTFTDEGLRAALEIRQRFPSIGILVLSAYVEVDQALELLGSGNRVGYLLKSQITEAGQLADVLEQISRGGSVADPSLVRELVATYRSEDPLTRLTPDEHDVLALVAQGRSDVGIAQALRITEEEAGRQVRSVFTKLCLPEPGTDHHRVLAVLAFLEARLPGDGNPAPDHLAVIGGAVPPGVGQGVNQQQPSPAVTGQLRFLQRRNSGAGVPDLRHQPGVGDVHVERDHLQTAWIAPGLVRRGLDGIGDQLRHQ
jgi:DNA-binding NarL/FixJ family response regulator